jgi:Na+/H+-dicarboxylate symporter
LGNLVDRVVYATAALFVFVVLGLTRASSVFIFKFIAYIRTSC